MGFERVNKSKPCPVCDHSDWCLVAEDRSAAICPRIESDKRAGDAGWLHVIDESKRQRSHGFMIRTGTKAAKDFDSIATQYECNLNHGDRSLLAGRLCVSTESLRRLRVGRIDDHRYSWPMSDAEGHVIGVRIRTDDGQKYCVKGSKTGLFVPSGLTGDGPLLLPEGPSDCAAAISIGFDAIGRPNAGSMSKMVCRACRGRNEVVVVADNDDIGHRSAFSLSESLTLYCPSVRIITPPHEIKDLRDWVRHGLTHEDLVKLISNTQSITKGIK